VTYQQAQKAPVSRTGLKVLMVAPTSFFNDYGGHIRILEETLALERLGHQVTIATYYMGHDVGGLDIRRTPSLPWHAQYEVGSSRHKIAFDAYLAAKVLKLGFQLRPDIVHGHMHEGALIGGLVARLLRAPVVFDYQGSLTGEMVDHRFLNPAGRFYVLMRRLERFINHLPDAILTSSERAQQSLQADFGVKPDVIRALPDCVDMERFNPDQLDPAQKRELKRSLGIPEGRSIVAYLGLLADYQGIPQVIEAAARLVQGGADVHFLIMGYPRVRYYRQMAQAAGLAERMTFTGKMSYADAPQYLSLGDMAVSAKVSATEGSGKVLNYMAMGQPVVASDTPVHREYLDSLGIYGPPGDAEGLARGFQWLLADRARARALGKQLQERARTRYSWRKAGQQIDSLYRELVGRAASGEQSTIRT
jgi:glycosyltransferase involved in cell wall biosynthesis